MSKPPVLRPTATHAVPALTLHTASGTALVIPTPLAQQRPFLAGLALGTVLGALLTAALTAQRRAA